MKAGQKLAKLLLDVIHTFFGLKEVGVSLASTRRLLTADSLHMTMARKSKLTTIVCSSHVLSVTARLFLFF